jgi:hypothetical protein
MPPRRHQNQPPAPGITPHKNDTNDIKNELDRVPQRTRNGRVARLPREIRDRVKQMLDNSLTYPEIVNALAALGYPGLSTHSIRCWKWGGYQDSLRSEEQRDLEKARSEAFLGCVKEFKERSLLLAGEAERESRLTSHEFS